MAHGGRGFGAWFSRALAVVALGCSGGHSGSGPAVGSGGASGGLGGAPGSGVAGATMGSAGAGGAAASASAGAGGVGGAMAPATKGMPTPSGGTINGGVCVPAPGPTRMDLGAQVHVLAQGWPEGLAADSSGVYYGIENSGLFHILPNSDTPEMIVATPKMRYRPWLAGKYLYYEIVDPMMSTSAGPVERLPLADLEAKPQRLFDVRPDWFAADATYIYVPDAQMHAIYRQAIGGSSRDVLVPNVDAGGLELGDDGFLYYSWSPSSEIISRVPVAGGKPEDVVTGDILTLGSYLVAKEGIYWNDWHGLSFTAFGQPKQAKTFAVDASMLSAHHYPLAVVGDRLFWVWDQFSGGTVGWTKLDLSDCKSVIDAGNDYNDAAIGPDGIYIGTFTTGAELYRIQGP